MTSLASSLTSLEGRYGRTLYELAPSSKDIPEMIEEARSFWSTIQDDPSLKKSLLTKLVHQDIQLKIAKKLVKVFKVSDLMERFIFLLIQKGRFSEFSKIIDHVETLYHHGEGIMDIQVCYANPFSKDERESLKRLLGNQYGKNLEIKFIEDPSLIAGYRVHLPTKVLDASFSKQLRLIQQHIFEGSL